jgi:hypothetical protein
MWSYGRQRSTLSQVCSEERFGWDLTPETENENPHYSEKFLDSSSSAPLNPQGNTKHRVRDLVQPRFCRGKRDKNR